MTIMENDVWEVVPRPQDKTIVTFKWLYKIKHATDESTEKYKARFVARGFSQKEGIDYDVKFAPVARYTTIRSIIALAASQGWNLHQMDRLRSCTVRSKKRLKKALYGLKQAPRAGYERIDSYLMKLGFTRSGADPNLYLKVRDDKPLRLVLYVDDLFLTGADPLIHKCKRELAFEFEMKDQGLELWQKPMEIFLSQGKYVVKILKRFSMVDCKPVTTSRILTFRSYMIDAKNLLYLRGTITNGLRYTAGDVRLLGDTDVDWAGSVVDRKNTFGCCFTLGSASISWMSRKQKLVALSTAEAEYIAASMVSCEAFWL
eukprot:PITA_14164